MSDIVYHLLVGFVFGFMLDAITLIVVGLRWKKAKLCFLGLAFLIVIAVSCVAGFHTGIQCTINEVKDVLLEKFNLEIR